MRGQKEGLKKFVLSGLIIVALTSMIVTWWRIPHWTEDFVTVTINDKERVVNGESSRYLVFTDVETFANSDDLRVGKFDSSDLYGRLQPGARYRLRVYGWRWPFFSTYRNIISAEQQESSK